MADAWSFGGLILYRPELDQYLNSPDGQTGKYLKRRGRLITIAAKAKVGVDTGQLKASIKMVHRRSSGGQFVQIGSDVGHALAHHEGTRPHLITPTNQDMLRFSSGGRMVYTRRVMHPGTRPNRYLSDNLVIALV